MALLKITVAGLTARHTTAGIVNPKGIGPQRARKVKFFLDDTILFFGEHHSIWRGLWPLLGASPRI